VTILVTIAVPTRTTALAIALLGRPQVGPPSRSPRPRAALATVGRLLGQCVVRRSGKRSIGTQSRSQYEGNKGKLDAAWDNLFWRNLDADYDRAMKRSRTTTPNAAVDPWPWLGACAPRPRAACAPRSRAAAAAPRSAAAAGWNLGPAGLPALSGPARSAAKIAHRPGAHQPPRNGLIGSALA
jgi:hypothetical protein